MQFYAGLNLLILKPQKVEFDREVGPVSRQQGAVFTLVSQPGPFGWRQKCLQRQGEEGWGLNKATS